MYVELIILCIIQILVLGGFFTICCFISRIVEKQDIIHTEPLPQYTSIQITSDLPPNYDIVYPPPCYINHVNS